MHPFLNCLTALLSILLLLLVPPSNSLAITPRQYEPYYFDITIFTHANCVESNEQPEPWHGEGGAGKMDCWAYCINVTDAGSLTVTGEVIADYVRVWSDWNCKGMAWYLNEEERHGRCHSQLFGSVEVYRHDCGGWEGNPMTYGIGGWK